MDRSKSSNINYSTHPKRARQVLTFRTAKKKKQVKVENENIYFLLKQQVGFFGES